MKETFFFYDLETSGVHPAGQRIMQFAGQRTDLQLRPIGEPMEMLVRLTDEILPDPEAILIHGITPQRTQQEGHSEPEFITRLMDDVFTANTVMTGYNNLRFDDQFIRQTLYRNLADPYAWQWMDRRSRWDLLDVGRMMRALRPEGIAWPINDEQKPSHRLGDLAKMNKLPQEKAHDALSDVRTTIALASLIRQKQPRLFEFLLEHRGKKAAAKIVRPDDPRPFVYTSGRYSPQWLKTTVAVVIGPDPTKNDAFLVYDLRYAPQAFTKMDAEAMLKLMTARYIKDQSRPEFPIKSLTLSHCPAVAPLSVLDEETLSRLSLDISEVMVNFKALRRHPQLMRQAAEAFRQMKDYPKAQDVDYQLYDGWYDDPDKAQLDQVRQMTADQLAAYQPQFQDERLEALLFRYRARHYRETLTDAETKKYDEWRQLRLKDGQPGQLSLENYLARLEELAKGDAQPFLLEELKLWGQSIIPEIG